MNYIKETVLLAVISFFGLITAIVFNMLRSTLFTQLLIAANNTHPTSPAYADDWVYNQMLPLLNNFTLVFWMVFFFFAIGAIACYALGSHKEEYEQYK